MTVFAVLYSDVDKGNEPIFISDVLVTSYAQLKKEERYSKVYIPSVGGLFPHMKPQSVLAGVMQKMHIIDGKTLLVFAGDLSDIREFYSALKSSDINQYGSLFAKYQYRLQFAWSIAGDEVEPTLVCVTSSCSDLAPGSYGRVFIGGSGEAAFRELVLEHQKMTTEGEEDPLIRALFLVSAALHLDSHTPSKSIEDGFGGYYEIGCHTKGGYFKLEHILFSYWTVVFDMDTRTVLWKPLKMFVHEYVEDLLVVRRIHVSYRGSNPPDIWQDCYAISSLDVRASIAVVEKVSKTPPNPVMEILSVDVYGSTMRFSSMDLPIIQFEKEGELWVIKPNQTHLNRYSQSIINTIKANFPDEWVEAPQDS